MAPVDVPASTASSTLASSTTSSSTPGEPVKPWDISLIGGLLGAFLAIALLTVIIVLLCYTRKRTPPLVGSGINGVSARPPTPGMRSEKSLSSAMAISAAPSLTGLPRTLTRDPSSSGMSARSGFQAQLISAPRMTRSQTGLGPSELEEEEDEDEKVDVDADGSGAEGSTSGTGSRTRVNTRYSSRSNFKPSLSSRSASRSASTSNSSMSSAIPTSLPRLPPQAKHAY